MKTKTLFATLILLFAVLAATAQPATAETKSFTVRLHEPGEEYSTFHVSPETMTVNEGDTVQLTIENPDFQEKPHAFKLEAFGIDTGPLQPGQSTTETFVADQAGEFTYECTEPGHAGGGERGTLIVQGAGGGDGESRGAPGPAAGMMFAALGAAAVALARRRA